MEKRPNFLLFITDQQRHDHLGCMGNLLLKTPNIDRLAADGTIINQFYVASPVCQPNRASLMTGRMPSLHGLRHNGISLDRNATTFVHQLRDAGYKTALIGKSHLQNFLDLEPGYERPFPPEGFEPPHQEHAEALHKSTDDRDYLYEKGSSWADPNFNIPIPYYGFDFIRLLTGHGDNVGGHYRHWLAANRTDAQQPGIEHALAHSEYGSPQTYQTAVPPHLHHTAYVAQETSSYLDKYAESGTDAPFFIQCSFPDPHHPFAVPGKYWDMYDPKAVTLPRSFYDSSHEQTPPLAIIYEQYKTSSTPVGWTAPFIADEMPAKEMIAKTYGMISFIDDAVGQVMGKLKHLGLDETTVVCFISDHGDWLGSHGLFLKGPLHYQSLIRMPFIWRDCNPTYNSGRQDAIGSTIDLGCTLLHRAKIAPFNGNQGKNLLPVLAGDPTMGHENVLVEQTTQYIYLGLDRIMRVFSLVSKKWRLTVWEGKEWGELYDLQADPEELNNLWDDSQFAAEKSHFLLQMVQRMQSLNDTSPFPSAIA
ncbi:Sulfatase [hydrothermal vent metagenome]|uniref:Sulfatase n=1 Tax=hydrothermal vent metagenome TaxID=652676 RepID=A0A3B0VIK1_9ZZZZ